MNFVMTCCWLELKESKCDIVSVFSKFFIRLLAATLRPIQCEMLCFGESDHQTFYIARVRCRQMSLEVLGYLNIHSRFDCKKRVILNSAIYPYQLVEVLRGISWKYDTLILLVLAYCYPFRTMMVSTVIVKCFYELWLCVTLIQWTVYLNLCVILHDIESTVLKRESD